MMSGKAEYLLAIGEDKKSKLFEVYSKKLMEYTPKSLLFCHLGEVEPKHFSILMVYVEIMLTR